MNYISHHDWFRMTQSMLQKVERDAHSIYLMGGGGKPGFIHIISVIIRYTQYNTMLWSVDATTKAYPNKKYET
jgi:hypothetical protein